MTIILKDCVTVGNGLSGARFGPGTDVQVDNLLSARNAENGVSIHPDANVTLSRVRTEENGKYGIFIEDFARFMDAFPELKGGVDPNTLATAAIQVAQAEPGAREPALKQTKLYSLLAGGGFVNWAQLIVALVQLGADLSK